ncbi:Derlin [Lachnellula occidentalis]|uniref:Derlin n=1 Tax=Lachnellula occidentalis TaxID=215460 RepID=A0A8H8SA20_9HELO|nr:Derlin [Lachnellula occidentalis]
MSAIDYFKQAPPISRTIAASAFVLSISAYLNVIPFYYVMFIKETFIQLPPQIWRLVTAFLITGPKFGIIFDTYFLYTYGSKLEKASPKFSQPGDFLTYILFVCTVIVGLNMAFTGAYLFTSALVLAFAYTSCQDDRGMQATFYIMQIPAQYMPFAMILMILIMDSPQQALIAATGLVAAHLHDFLTRLWPEFGGGTNLVPTPAFIKRLFQTRTTTVSRKAYGTSIAPPESSGSGSSSGVLPESWKARGSGHRLGGS